MPTYEYFCEQCDDHFEAVQRFSDAPLTACPTGHNTVRRVIRPAGIIFKGSGWYIKDSKASGTIPNGTAKPADKPSEKAADGNGSKEATKSEPAKSETTKTEPAKGEANKGEAA